MTSSDILGIELGRRVIRGVRLDQHRAELIAVAECQLLHDGLSADGIVDISVVGPSLEDVLARLKVTDRSQVRIGFAVGPRNSGVGSGPTMTGWLEQQARNLRENMQSAGGLGQAFVPSRAVDAAIKLSRDGGIDLARLDLAPVAAARAIGCQVDDRICLGSGHGWQARMRDLEVLEAKENLDVTFDAPVTLVDHRGTPRLLERYGWVDLSDGLIQAGGINIPQMAVAVGVAIGIAYESPADLLQSKLVPGEPDESELDPSFAGMADQNQTSGAGPEPTLRLQTIKPAVEEAADADTDDVDAHIDAIAEAVAEEGRREALDSPETLTSVQRVAEMTLPLGQAVRGHDVDPSGHGEQQAEHHPVAHQDEATDHDGAHASEMIDMFSPDTDERHMLGKRDRRLTTDIVVTLIVVVAIIAAAYFFVL